MKGLGVMFWILGTTTFLWLAWLGVQFDHYAHGCGAVDWMPFA